jgi:hypothetical protein
MPPPPPWPRLCEPRRLAWRSKFPPPPLGRKASRVVGFFGAGLADGEPPCRLAVGCVGRFAAPAVRFGS